MGIPHAKFEAIGDHAASSLFTEPEHAALQMADAMTLVGTVPDALFAAVARHFTADQVVELTMTIAWENASARFNRALHVSSTGLYQGGALGWPQLPDW
ncbi:MAG: hypothetical protein M3Z04_04455 [Chloroflexota bacterium]|nr:hypothetical protein [Chloroflexota bacterium]